MKTKQFRSFNNDDEDLVTKYFKDIKKSELLTPIEEKRLAKNIKSGDKKAIDTLVKANLKFAVKIAKDYQGNGLSLPDLISEANYGLVKAASKFDHTRDIRFISYAVWWIRQSIMESLNNNVRTIRLPVNVITKMARQKRDVEKFEFNNERNIIHGFDENSDTLEIYDKLKCNSLNEIINEDGDEIGDLIASEDEMVDFEKPYIDDKIKKELNKALDILDEREMDIIKCYFSLDRDSESMTLEAIGEKHGLTKERIRQIKSSAIRKLRNNTDELFKAVNK